jgi:hypothetical protein
LGIITNLLTPPSPLDDSYFLRIIELAKIGLQNLERQWFIDQNIENKQFIKGSGLQVQRSWVPP